MSSPLLPQLASYFKTYSDSDKNRITRFIQNDVLCRTPKMCNVIEKNGQKVVYRRYASLYFIAGVQPDQNELAVLEEIHLFVEVRLLSYYTVNNTIDRRNKACLAKILQQTRHTL